jgi:hypothetical protein
LQLAAKSVRLSILGFGTFTVLVNSMLFCNLFYLTCHTSESTFEVRINSNAMKKFSLLLSSATISLPIHMGLVIARLKSMLNIPNKTSQLRVFNAAGQLIHQQQLQPLAEHQIIAHNWQPGVYFYRVETPSATTSGKLIRE